MVGRWHADEPVQPRVMRYTADAPRASASRYLDNHIRACTYAPATRHDHTRPMSCSSTDRPCTRADTPDPRTDEVDCSRWDNQTPGSTSAVVVLEDRRKTTRRTSTHPACTMVYTFAALPAAGDSPYSGSRTSLCRFAFALGCCYTCPNRRMSRYPACTTLAHRLRHHRHPLQTQTPRWRMYPLQPQR